MQTVDALCLVSVPLISVSVLLLDRSDYDQSLTGLQMAVSETLNLCISPTPDFGTSAHPWPWLGRGEKWSRCSSSQRVKALTLIRNILNSAAHQQKPWCKANKTFQHWHFICSSLKKNKTKRKNRRGVEELSQIKETLQWPQAGNNQSRKSL